MNNLGSETEESYPHYHRNFSAFLIDYSLFGVAMAFISSNTVLPTFIRQLTDSPLLVGLGGTIQTAGWLFPQLIAAHYLRGKAQKKRYLLIPAAIGRPIPFALALALVLGAAQVPDLILAMVFVGMTLFWVSDALSTVAWFDIVGQIFPANRRGRLFGLGQIISGVLTVGAGFAISYILSDAGPQFPHNYAILFLAAGTLLVLCWLAEVCIKEPLRVIRDADAPPQTFLRQLTRIWRQDRDFRLFIAVRLLTGLGGLAIPFYVVFATDRLELGESVVGSFTSAQVIGNMVGGAILGALYEKQGGRRAIQAGAGAGFFAPLWALVLPAFVSPGHAWVVFGYSLVFVALGVLHATFMQGFSNYLIDLAPSNERATYIALSNTINGAVLWPVALIGGTILKITDNSFPTLFVVTALGTGLGLLCTAWLTDPGRR